MFEDTLFSLENVSGSADGLSNSTRPARERRILVVLHQEHSNPGRVGRMLREQGFRLDVRRPRFGDPLPRTLDRHDAAIVFGGPMSANDDEAWIRREIDWIGVALREAKPFLGICLGAQMLARHLGHRVAPHPQGRVEVGYYPIRSTEQGRKTWPTVFPSKVYQWHREGFELPHGATLLAEGDDFQAQAFRYGCGAYGFQFHPEVTYQMMCRWTTLGTERLAMPGALARERHFHDWFVHDATVARWLDSFLRHWMAGKPTRSRQGSELRKLGAMVPQPRYA